MTVAAYLRIRHRSWRSKKKMKAIKWGYWPFFLPSHLRQVLCCFSTSKRELWSVLTSWALQSPAVVRPPHAVVLDFRTQGPSELEMSLIWDTWECRGPDWAQEGTVHSRPGFEAICWSVRGEIFWGRNFLYLKHVMNVLKIQSCLEDLYSGEGGTSDKYMGMNVKQLWKENDGRPSHAPHTLEGGLNGKEFQLCLRRKKKKATFLHSECVNIK